MAFKEFETEEAYNTEIESVATERVNKIMEDKNPWLNERLQTARNAAIKEANELKDKEYAEKLEAYADYDSLKESISNYEEKIKGYEEKIAGYKKADAELEAAKLDTIKLKAALKYGIDIEDVDRLKGSDEEEIEKDAKKFAEKHIKPQGYPIRQGGVDPIDGVTEAFKRLNPNLKI